MATSHAVPAGEQPNQRERRRRLAKRSANPAGYPSSYGSTLNGAMRSRHSPHAAGFADEVCHKVENGEAATGQWRGAGQASAAAEQQEDTFRASLQAPLQLSGGERPSEAAPSNSANAKLPGNHWRLSNGPTYDCPAEVHTTRDSFCCARFVTGRSGPEDRAMICAARNEAHGFRAEARKRREDDAEDALDLSPFSLKPNDVAVQRQRYGEIIRQDGGANSLGLASADSSGDMGEASGEQGQRICAAWRF